MWFLLVSIVLVWISVLKVTYTSVLRTMEKRYGSSSWVLEISGAKIQALRIVLVSLERKSGGSWIHLCWWGEECLPQLGTLDM